MKKPKRPRELPANKLRWRCDPRTLRFRSPADVGRCTEIIGQERAVRALQLGLEFRSPGYNIYVCGLTGTSKTTGIQRLLHEMNLPGGPPPDLCFVQNFRQPESPLVMMLPAGQGRVLRKDLQDLGDDLRRALPALFDGQPFKDARAHLETEFRERIRGLFDAFDRRVRRAGFRLVQVELGPATRTEIHVVVNDKPVAMHDHLARAARRTGAARQRAALAKRHAALTAELAALVRAGRVHERQMRAAVRTLVRQFGAPVLCEPLADLRDKYATSPRVAAWLGTVEEALQDALERVANTPGDADDIVPDDILIALDACQVNVAVDNAGQSRPPVVVETAPTFRNLFGGVERTLERSLPPRGEHLNIRAGSFLRANGGYLVFNLADAGAEAAVWPALKRTLRNMRIEIPSYDPLTGQAGTGLKPEPVDLHVKVVVIGDSFTYQALYDHDEDFRSIFKVKADFDSSMPRSRRALSDSVRVIAGVVRDEKLLPLDAGAVAAVLEASARLAGRQDKLSTHFSDIADIVREAHYWATKERRRTVSAAQVERALAARLHRVGLVEAKLQEAFDNGQMLIDLRGRKVGQVNALTVFDFGDHIFGRPARITSQVSMGRSGIVNIEREANLSGPAHDKGVLILAGYLRAMYAQDKPLTLSASLAFEQSYGGVDGDSATAAEVYALFSAIANVPARQDLAITGSIDQRGQIQPVGGVNEKIEGFFDVCQARGLSGTQGVLMPAQNAADLMLRKDVVAAVRRRHFHIYPLRTIDDGIELLFGMKAGRRRRHRFEIDTLHRRVDDALFELADGIKEFMDGADTPSGHGGGPGLADEEADVGEVRARRMPARSRRRRP